MKDFDKVMKKEMLDFKNDMLRHFFRDNFYDNFNQRFILKHNRVHIDAIYCEHDNSRRSITHRDWITNMDFNRYQYNERFGNIVIF